MVVLVVLAGFFALYAATMQQSINAEKKLHSALTSEDVSKLRESVSQLLEHGVLVRVDPSPRVSRVVVGQSFYTLAGTDQGNVMLACAGVCQADGGAADLEVLDWRDNRRVAFYHVGMGLSWQR